MRRTWKTNRGTLCVTISQDRVLSRNCWRRMPAINSRQTQLLSTDSVLAAAYSVYWQAMITTPKGKSWQTHNRKQSVRSLTLFYFNFLSLLPSSFMIFYLSSTPDEDHGSKALMFLIVLYVSSYRWVHLSRAVLFSLSDDSTHSFWLSNGWSRNLEYSNKRLDG